MNTWIALFRGINVGGHNKLPMNPLRAEMAELGLTSVQTYIASGNLVFDSEETNAASLAAQISASVEKTPWLCAKSACYHQNPPRPDHRPMPVQSGARRRPPPPHFLLGRNRRGQRHHPVQRPKTRQ